MDISGWNKHAVNISGYDSSGFLKNSSFEVLPGGQARNADGRTVSIEMLERVSTTQSQFKFKHDDDPNLKFQQTSAFYWAQYALEFLKNRTGKFWAEGKNTKIYTYNPGYKSAGHNQISNAVFLGGPQDNSTTVDGEVIIHELGHANIVWATHQAIYQIQGGQEVMRACPIYSKLSCCLTRAGCAEAINEAVADYHASIVFPSAPQIGENIVNDPAGLTGTDIYRNPTLNRELTADRAFNAITKKGESVPGHEYAMATLYTSIWWEIRLAAKNVTGGSIRDIDVLFSEHLQALNGSDTFLSAREKILAFDANLFAGKYSNVIRAEFQRRGYD